MEDQKSGVPAGDHRSSTVDEDIEGSGVIKTKRTQLTHVSWRVSGWFSTKMVCVADR